MELYTSLTRLKMAMNGGIPPLTPLSPDLAKIFSTPGLGMIEADEKSERLKCPVAGCSQRGAPGRRLFFDRLGAHLNRCHQDLGGERGVKRKLEIPSTASLTSGPYHERVSQAHTGRHYRLPDIPHEKLVEIRVRRAKERKDRTLAGAHNLYDRCVAQLSAKLSDLTTKLGRSPTQSDCRYAWGSKFVTDLQKVFGGLDNAKAHIGIATNHYKYGLIDLLSCMQAFYARHHDLPRARFAMRTMSAKPVPAIPSYKSILRITGARTWDEAMQQVAAALDIHGGRYGLPPEAKTA